MVTVNKKSEIFGLNKSLMKIFSEFSEDVMDSYKRSVLPYFSQEEETGPQKKRERL